jgi:hypothetical protein
MDFVKENRFFFFGEENRCKHGAAVVSESCERHFTKRLLPQPTLQRG